MGWAREFSAFVTVITFFFSVIIFNGLNFFFPLLSIVSPAPTSNYSPTPLLVTLTNHCDRCRYSRHYYVVFCRLTAVNESKMTHSNLLHSVLFTPRAKIKYTTRFCKLVTEFFFAFSRVFFAAATACSMTRQSITALPSYYLCIVFLYCYYFLASCAWLC